MMKEIIEKISSYNLFNYLLPGIIFVYLISTITTINIIQENLLIGAFLYYFIGLIISRIGSVIIEPLLRKSKFVRFAEYSDFVKYSQQDSKIDTLSESNNMYRTLISMFLCLLILKGYSWLADKWEINNKMSIVILVVSLLILFLFSYKKQTNYITKRIEAHKNNGTQQ